MQIVKPSFRPIEFDGTMTPYEFIEIIGRTCYKSTDLITKGSADKFVRNLCERKHYAMLEHFCVHIVGNYYYYTLLAGFNMLAEHYRLRGDAFDFTKYFHFSFVNDKVFISASLRVFLELDAFLSAPEDLWINGSNHIPVRIKQLLYLVGTKFEGLYDPKPYRSSLDDVSLELDVYNFVSRLSLALEDCNYEKSDVDREIRKHVTHTCLFVCDRGVSHEIVRHRPCSFAQESTRYCNYSKDKFGNEITVIEPFFFVNSLNNEQWAERYGAWAESCQQSEEAYFNLINAGATPQEARTVLPNSLKTEVIVTTNEEEWQHIVDLRVKGVTGAPHPQMVEVMTPCYEYLKEVSEGRIQ